MGSKEELADPSFRIQAYLEVSSLEGSYVGTDKATSPLFTSPGEVVVSFILPNVFQQLPYSDPSAEWLSELQGVSIVDSVDRRTLPPGHPFAIVMAGSTNNQFRQGAPRTVLVSPVQRGSASSDNGWYERHLVPRSRVVNLDLVRHGS